VEKLGTFLSKSGLSRQEREVLWTLLAHAMRASAPGQPKRLVKVVKGKTTVKELLHPFAHFLAAVGAQSQALDVLDQHLRGREWRFPFGAIAVDGRGHVLELTVEDGEKRAESARVVRRIHTA